MRGGQLFLSPGRVQRWLYGCELFGPVSHMRDFYPSHGPGVEPGGRPSTGAAAANSGLFLEDTFLECSRYEFIQPGRFTDV